MLCLQHFSIMSQFCAKHRLGARPISADLLTFDGPSGVLEKVVVEADGPPPLDDADKILSLQVRGGGLPTCLPACLPAWLAIRGLIWQLSACGEVAG